MRVALRIGVSEGESKDDGVGEHEGKDQCEAARANGSDGHVPKCKHQYHPRLTMLKSAIAVTYLHSLF